MAKITGSSRVVGGGFRWNLPVEGSVKRMRGAGLMVEMILMHGFAAALTDKTEEDAVAPGEVFKFEMIRVCSLSGTSLQESSALTEPGVAPRLSSVAVRALLKLEARGNSKGLEGTIVTALEEEELSEGALRMLRYEVSWFSWFGCMISRCNCRSCHLAV